MRLHLPKLILICVLIATVSGCAHQRHTDNANDYFSQGRYELAAREFEKALAIKPDNADTQAGYQLTRDYLDDWLDGVEQAAELAYSSQHPGRALILYGKLLQWRQDERALGRYQQLTAELVRRHRHRLVLNYDPSIFGANFGADIPGLDSVTSTRRAAVMEVANFELGDYNSKINYKDEIRSQSYLSGVETVANPDYLHLQEAIHQERSDVRRFRRELRHQRNHLRAVTRKRDHVRQVVDKITAELEVLEPGSERFKSLKSDLKAQQEQLAHWNRKVSKNQHKLEKTEHRYHAAEHQLADLYEQLSLLPPTVEQDVYSDYEYEIGILTQTVSADLSITIAGVHKSTRVAASASDVEHAAHPTINLPAKAAVLDFNSELQGQVNLQAANLARDALVALVERHRHSLLMAAEQAYDPAQRFEHWVAYALAGDQSPNAQVEANIRRYLQLELGYVGEFPVRQLLDLYGDQLARAL